MKKFILFLFFGALFFGTYAQNTYWEIFGNSSIPNGSFIGTTDCKPLVFGTRKMERMWLAKDRSFLGIGIKDPFASLHIHYQNDKEPCPLQGGPGGGYEERDGDEDTTSTRGIVRNLLHLTTPETGTNSYNGFSVSYQNLDLTFWQLEKGKFFIKGPGGGLTITPEGKIGIGTDVPKEKLEVAGNVKAQNADIANNLTTQRLYAQDAAIGILWGVKQIYARSAAIDTLWGVHVLHAQKARIGERLCAKKVVVTDPACWPDFVFAKDYNLRPLSELEQFIKENHHLPEIPTEAEVQENGIDLGSMQSKLLLKIEELTLYILDLQKQIDELKQSKRR